MIQRYICVYFFACWLLVLYPSNSQNNRINSTENLSWQLCDFQTMEVLSCTFIPVNLPEGTHHVSLRDINTSDGSLYGSPFSGENWNGIVYLEILNTKEFARLVSIEADAFDGLENLRELHIHVGTLTNISQDSFLNITLVEVLNLNGCHSLDYRQVYAVLEDEDMLPNLEKVYLSGINKKPWDLGVDFPFAAITILKSRNLKAIDISYSGDYFDFEFYQFIKGFNRLEYLNITGIKVITMPICISYDIFDVISSTDGTTSGIRMFDLSYVDFYPFGSVCYSSSFNFELPQLVTLNMEGVFQTRKTGLIVSTKMFNGSILFSFKTNNLKEFPIGISCKPVQKITLANNNIEFINHDVFMCLTNLVHINLSRNRLFVMASTNNSVFKGLFSPLVNLTHIDVSFNNLTDISDLAFTHNSKLEYIDFSSNSFAFVPLVMKDLSNLRILDLSNNKIKFIGFKERQVLNSLPTHVSLKLRSNPFECTECSFVELGEWLSSSDVVSVQNVQCLGSKGDKTRVSNALSSLKPICQTSVGIDSKVIVTLCIVVPIVSLATLILSIFIIKIILKRKGKERQAEEVNMHVKNNEGFLVFLSFCSEDDCFVKDFIFENLNENLRKLTKVNRDLVCIGDKYFRLGKPIPDEMSELMDKSAVVVAVISNEFCQSSYCRTEIHHAFLKEKPILLMLKGKVDVELMTPLIKDLYNGYTRIMWEYEDDTYKLKTTWENICESVLNLIDIGQLNDLRNRI